MKLYLMQHGEAKAESEDPERPLTDRARDEVGRVAGVAARLDLGIQEVRHSGKLRARQTAEIVAAALGLTGRVVEVAGLSPRDDPRAIAEQVAGTTETVLFVGHLPHLGRLTALLVTGQSERAVLGFRTGALVRLERPASDWQLQWVITPEMAAWLPKP